MIFIIIISSIMFNIIHKIAELYELLFKSPFKCTLCLMINILNYYHNYLCVIFFNNIPP